MRSMIAATGNKGPGVRSDCAITLECKSKGGITIDLKSKVDALYGESIKDLCTRVLDFYRIKNADLKIDDSGALSFVIAARLEAAVKEIIDTDLEFMPEMLRENRYSTSPERYRFSRLYIPGNTPSMMINAGLYSADGIILDLEDSVAPEKKDEARILVRNTLRQIDFRGAERMVRINNGETGLKDLHMILPHNVNLILIPKCETAEQIHTVNSEISRIRTDLKINNIVFLMPVIESALGIENSFEIARAAENIVAMAIGLEDLTADLGVRRTTEGSESFYARSRFVIAARAAGIQPIDSVFSDISDMEALKDYVLMSKAIGFEGMGCIHPGQVPIVNQGFAPDETEIEKSKEIITAFKEARQKGLGVVALGSKMIDLPVVKRAQKIVNLAVKLGKLDQQWFEEIVDSQKE